jgi:uncharacterized repeat protein (TIGR01451 family)
MQIRKEISATKSNNSQIKVEGFMASLRATGTWAATAIFCLICLCSTVGATDYYVGQTYMFSAHSYPGYLYLWTAEDELGNSVGIYTDNTHADFVWKAPSFVSKVKVSVLITSNLLDSCKEYGEVVFDLLPLNSITVVKEALPSDPQSFDFSLTGQADFSLIDNGDPTVSQKSFSDLMGGTYVISEENLPAGWDLSDISVTGIASTPVIDKTAGTISFDLVSGEASTVTFTNTKRSNIVVVKDALPNDLQDFNFNANGPGGYVSSFVLDDDSGVTGEDNLNSDTQTLSNLMPGTYTIAESDLPGWDLTGIDIVDPDGGSSVDLVSKTATIDLDPGELITVTYANTKRQIDLAVSVTADEAACCGGPINYLITLTNGNPTIAATNIVVRDILDANTALEHATPSEGDFDSATMQWTISSIAPGASATLTLVATCSPTYVGTIINQVQIVSFDLMDNDPDISNNEATASTSVKGCGSITIIKDAIPVDGTGYSSQVFTYSSDALGTFTLVDDGSGSSSDRITFNNLVPGDYQIVEQSETDWRLNNVIGNGATSEDVLGQGGELIGKLVHLGIDDEVTLTFVNAQSMGPLPNTGRIIVDKVTLPTGDAQTFAFTPSYGPAFSLSDTSDPNDSGLVEIGTYSIAETAVAGWDLTDLSVSGIASTPTIDRSTGTVKFDLAKDETARVTFTNTKRGSITVIKDAIPIDGTGYSDQVFTFRGDALGSFTLVDDGPQGSSDRITFNDLMPGDYQIIEQSIADWTLNFINCIGADSTDLQPDVSGIIVHLGEGESATVTFGNAQSTSPLPPIKGILTIEKTTLNTSVYQGEDISYTIKVCNAGVPNTGTDFGTLTNVNVVDILPKNVVLLSVYPEPTTGLTWNVGSLGPGECFEAHLTVRVPDTDFRYDMSQGVKGEGFVNVYNNYDTTVDPGYIQNCAYATADGVGTVSDCANTTVIKEPGTQLHRREFGSGTYASEELSKVRSENKSIIADTSLQASYRPSSFVLPQGRSIDYKTLWTEKSKARNTVTGASMTEEYTSATKIDKERSMELDKNGSIMKTEVEFTGQGHIGVLKKQSPNSHPKARTIFESREDYAGSFKIYEMVDEYGSSVISNKSTSGLGYVAVDKKIRGSQGTYESGSGSYHSEEVIYTPTSYMAKNISLVHSPANYSYSPSFVADQDMLWSEGMWSKSGGLSGGNLITDTGPSRKLAASSCLANGTSPGTLISEKYSNLDNLQKETIASGLNEMKTTAQFNGTADYRALSHGENGTDEVDNEERYVGRYEINRHVILTGTSKYDIPHLTVIKEGRIKNEWFNKVNATQAEYTITITNDGNRALAPIYVRDIFPAGTQYVKSSVRPARLDASEANWTLVNLGIGNTITIGLTLNITEGYPGNNLVNRVLACGLSGDKSVCAGNYSSLEVGWQTCCPPKVLVSKKAWLDESDPTVVHYRIALDNKAPDSIAVTITDQLPGGMTLLNASTSPNIDNAGQLIWALPEIKPGGIETIDYTTRALRDGGYTSIVHIDATAIDGTGYDTVDASAYIEITGTGVGAKTFRYGDWEPPAWNLSAPEPGLDMGPAMELDAIRN